MAISAVQSWTCRALALARTNVLAFRFCFSALKNTVVPHVSIRSRHWGPVTDARLMWVFQVGRQVIGKHSNIFNSRATSLMLALIQISGAVMSLAQTGLRASKRSCEVPDDPDDAR